MSGRDALVGEAETLFLGKAAHARQAATLRDQASADLIIEEAWPWESSGAERFVVQSWLDTICAPKDATEYVRSCVSEAVRRKLKRAAAAPYQFTWSRAPADADWFYRELMEPMAQARFGEAVSYGSLEVFLGMSGRTTQSEVRFVEHAGERIAGVALLISPPRRTVRVWSYGIRLDLLSDQGKRAEIMAALNAEAIRVAAAAGYVLNFGLTRPFLDDGVMIYKRRWGAQPVPSDSARMAVRFGSRTARDAVLSEAPLLHLAGAGVQPISAPAAAAAAAE